MTATNIVTYKYVYGTLKSSRCLNIEEEYLFYMQLKSLNTSSVFRRGFLKSLAKQLHLSEVTISNKFKRLIQHGFMFKSENKNGRLTNYNLRSYIEVYKNIFKLDDENLWVRTIKFKVKKHYDKKQLRNFIDMNETARFGSRIILKNNKDNGGLKQRKLTKRDLQSTEMVPYDDSIEISEKTLIYDTFNLSLIAIGKYLGNKSQTYALKIMNKLKKAGCCLKTNRKIEIIPENSQDEFMMKYSPDKRFYSKRHKKYFEQKTNSYSFIFNTRFSKHRDLRANIFRTLKSTLLTYFECFQSTSSLSVVI